MLYKLNAKDPEVAALLQAVNAYYQDAHTTVIAEVIPDTVLQPDGRVTFAHEVDFIFQQSAEMTDMETGLKVTQVLRSEALAFIHADSDGFFAYEDEDADEDLPDVLSVPAIALAMSVLEVAL